METTSIRFPIQLLLSGEFRLLGNASVRVSAATVYLFLPRRHLRLYSLLQQLLLLLLLQLLLEYNNQGDVSFGW
jgi:hypothetical protein